MLQNAYGVGFDEGWFDLRLQQHADNGGFRHGFVDSCRDCLICAAMHHDLRHSRPVMREDAGDSAVASRHASAECRQQSEPLRALVGRFKIALRDLHGRIYRHVAAFGMPADHNARRFLRREETFRPIQNRVRISICRFLRRHWAAHRHIEILFPADERAVSATERNI